MEFVALGTAILAGGATAIAQRNAGAQADIDARERAQQETDAYRDREIERRRRLVSALASQNAEGGALGAAPGVGSRAAIAMSDARTAGLDSLSDRASTNRRALLMRQGGRFAKRQGNLAAGATLLDTAGSTMNNWPG